MAPLVEMLGVVGERCLGCSQCAQHNWTKDDPANEGMWTKKTTKNEDKLLCIHRRKSESISVKRQDLQTNTSVLKFKRQREGRTIK